MSNLNRPGGRSNSAGAGPIAVAAVEALEGRRLLTSVQGSVIEDVNANGVRDANDTLPIWTPTIFADLNYNGSFDAGEPSTTQAFSNSTYRLQLPSGGTYLIRVILPESYIATIPASGSRMITIPDGLTTLGSDFGGWRSGRYAARSFHDTNGNGAMDDGEEPNAFRRALWADLDRDGVLDPIEPASTQDATGAQLELRPGSYSMRLDTPPGWTNTTAPDGIERMIEPGIANFPERLGQQATRNLLGTVANDDNGNEKLDPADTALAGWTVFADLNKNGLHESGEPFHLTQSDGSYALISVALDGPFNLRLLSPTGQLNSFSRSYRFGYTQNPFGNDDVLLRVTNVAHGRLFGDLNGNGIYEASSFYREYFAPGQLVYADVNNNAQRDAGEPTTWTDTGGTFVFAVPDGTYSIRPEPDDGYAMDPGFPAYPAKTFGGNGRMLLGTLPLIDNMPQRSHAHVQGTVFNDANRNSRWDPAEALQAGQTVYIDWNANLQRDPDEPTTLSDANGRYLLPDMHPSTGTGPIIRVETTSGWRNTQVGLGQGVNVQIYSGQGAFAPLGVYAVPNVGVASAAFDAGDRRSLHATFTHDLGASLQGGDFVLQRFFNGTWVDTSAQFALEGAVEEGRSVATLRLPQPLPDGRYRVRLLAQAIADVAGVKNAAAHDIEFSLTPPARVTDVFVAGSAWTQGYRDFLAASGVGDATYGYRLDAAGHADELMWVNLDRVSVRFSENVNLAAGALRVFGVYEPEYAGTVSYDSATFTATFQLASGVFAADKLLVHLDDVLVTDAAGATLDGEWTNPAETTPVTSGGADTYPSGNGTTGGDFGMRLNVLPGDVNRDGRIVGNDVTSVRGNQGFVPGGSGYTIFRDVTGDARIVGNDVTAVRSRQGITLPLGTPNVPATAVRTSSWAPSSRNYFAVRTLPRAWQASMWNPRWSLVLPLDAAEEAGERLRE